MANLQLGGLLGTYGVPMQEGLGLLKITASFDLETYELDMYLLDNAECANCKCLITAPTPLDHPNYGR